MGPGPDENSVILETDDGFTTLRVSGDDMAKVKDASGVAKDAKAAKDAKKGCGCDCLPKTGPGEKIKKGKEETKKKEEEAKEEDEKKKKEVEKLKGEAVKAKADAAKKKAEVEDVKKLEKAKKK